MIEHLSEKLAIHIKSANKNETASIPVLKFGLSIIINLLITLILSLLVGIVSGKPTETLATYIILLLIRYISGGSHFKSALHCIIFSTISISIIPHVTLSEVYNLILMIVSLILFAIFAPSNLKGHANIPEKYFPILKIVCLLTISSNFFIDSQLLTLIFAFQSLSIINLRRC